MKEAALKEATLKEAANAVAIVLKYAARRVVKERRYKRRDGSGGEATALAVTAQPMKDSLVAERTYTRSAEPGAAESFCRQHCRTRETRQSGHTNGVTETEDSDAAME